MSWMYKLKVMPLLVVVAALSFGVRFGEFVTGVSAVPGAAQAQMAKENSEDSSGKTDKQNARKALGEPPPIPSPPTLDEDGPRTAPVGKPSMEDGEEIDWKDAADSDLEFSEVRMELFKDLSARRKNIEEQQRELSVREALLKAAEQEISQKYKELVSLRSEIQTLLVKQSDEEKARTQSLVKIYEGMKPKDAARIFNTLDMDVLLSVISQMSERKSAPIIASMDPSRARTLTIMLMEQKSLPTMSDDLM